MGVSSFLYIWKFDGDGVLTFRWMTVDGTVFTTLISLFCLAVNAFEMFCYTELTSRFVYFLRLAAAVAESLILAVVLLSQLPFSPQAMHLWRYDMFQMHLVIPLLTVASFLLNDSPIGKLRPGKLLLGTLFVLFYAAAILSLILSGALAPEWIPYAFLDLSQIPALAAALCFALIFALSLLFSALLYRGNRRLSWIWFRGIAGQKRKPPCRS